MFLAGVGTLPAPITVIPRTLPDWDLSPLLSHKCPRSTNAERSEG